MKKLIYLIMFTSFFSYGQSYYGYKSRSDNDQKKTTNSKLSCDDAVKLIESKGRYLDVSFGGNNSDSIEKIRWYVYNSTLYCIVFFKTNTYKGYIYGGWKYNFETYYKFKTEFNNSDSKGEFFWEFIEEYKIDCD
jgi:hypothetical protein